MRLVLLASSAYLEKNGTPRTPSDLSRHVNMTTIAASKRSLSFCSATNGIEQVQIAPAYVANSAVAIRQAVLNGMGIAILSDELVKPDVDAQTLVRVLPDYTLEDATVITSIVVKRRQALAPRVTAFVDFTSNRFNEMRSPLATATH
jgi:DNA-binding transcriptional LysR family regulator